MGNFDGEDVTVIFNRDILINETEAIDNCGKSKGIISDETIVKQHPWVDDPEEELARLKAEKDRRLRRQMPTEPLLKFRRRQWAEHPTGQRSGGRCFE